MKKRFILPILTLIIVLGLIGGCYYMTMPVQGESEEVDFIINEGDGARTVIKNLKKANLIKNEYFTLVYYKINNTSKHPISFKAGDYYLNKADSLRDIIDTLNDSTAAKDKDSITLTFSDGGNLEDAAAVIANAYSLDVNDVIAQMDDKTFVQSLIDDKDFPIVTADVLDSQIRHPLEGYLHGNTYFFKKDETVQGIVKRLIKETNTIVTSYDKEFKKANINDVNYHDILTLASIVQHEGPAKTSSTYKKELQGVSQVFLNRIKINMTLGSDVTTYYSVRKKIGVDELYYADFNVCDGYNTRGTCVQGLPIGPISSASKDAIEAVVKSFTEPIHEYDDYYYFVADRNTNIHFSKTAADQDKVIQDLKNKNLWE